MFAVLEFQDFAIIGLLVAALAGGSAYAKVRPSNGVRIRIVERKLDAIIEHLGVELPEPLVKFGLSAEVCRLADEAKKIPAIKLHREETGVGLKEAKDAVEAYLGQ